MGRSRRRDARRPRGDGTFELTTRGNSLTIHVHGLLLVSDKRHPTAARAGRAALVLAFAALLAGRAEALPGQQKKHRHGEPAKHTPAEKPPNGPPHHHR